MQITSEQQQRSTPYLRYLLSALIFFGFVAFVQVYFGWLTLLQPWTQLSIAKLSLAVGLIFFSYWVRAMRFYDYFRNDMRNRFSLCFKLMIQHNLFNNLLPMRAGELSFPVLMARYFQVPALRSLPALLWFRLLDLHTLGIFALWAMAGIWFTKPITATVILAWALLPWIAFVFNRQLLKFSSARTQGRLSALLNKVLSGLPQTPRIFWWAWCWTLINWAVKLSVFAWVLMQFVDVPMAGALLGAIGGDLSSVLPVNAVANVGTYEAGVVAGLVPYKIPAAVALSAAVNLHLFLLAATMVSGAFTLLGRNRRAHG